MYMVERHIHGIMEALTKSNDNSEILRKIIDDMKPQAKRSLVKVFNAMLDEISTLKEKYSLQTREEKASNMVLAKMSEIWVILEDSRPEKISAAYGALDATDASTLRDDVLILLQKVNEIYAIMRSQHNI